MTNHSDQQPRLLDIIEAGQMLGIGRSSVYALIDAGELTSCKIGRRRLVPVTAIDAYVSRITA
jgi:excisionase family DNA binding protein